MALLAALALVLAMAVPAWAEEATYTITINNSVGTYEAYQIFKGDLAGNVLSNIEWGTGVTAEGKAAFGGKTAADVAKTLENNETAAKAFATEISKYLVDKDKVAGVGTTEISGLSAGYYLIKNRTVNDGSEAYTDFILRVVKNVEITPKGQKPTLKKQIKHNESGDWGVVGDNQIGDTVEFRTITTVPITTGYTEYVYAIHDDMSVGLTSNVKDASGITIKINDGEELGRDYYTVTVDSTNPNHFFVKVDILKAIKEGKIEEGEELYTYYSGVLNKDAKVYDEGNQKNTAFLLYSNNPHNNSSSGKTPPATVYDWTFKMNVQKVDGANPDNKLADAKFVLSKNGTVDLGTINEDGTPTKTDNLIKLVCDSENKTYRVATASDENTTYVMTAGDITIKGLDDAEYYLYETKAPAGYNRLTEPVKFRIYATYNSEGNSCTDVSTKVGDAEAAVTGLKVSVENNAGTTLPSTGGMGTTVFYVVGGGLMAVAVVLLVTKKRMENKR